MVGPPARSPAQMRHLYPGGRRDERHPLFTGPHLLSAAMNQPKTTARRLQIRNPRVFVDVADIRASQDRAARWRKERGNGSRWTGLGPRTTWEKRSRSHRERQAIPSIARSERGTRPSRGIRQPSIAPTRWGVRAHERPLQTEQKGRPRAGTSVV
jgi:hypothetical protein